MTDPEKIAFEARMEEIIDPNIRMTRTEAVNLAIFVKSVVSGDLSYANSLAPKGKKLLDNFAEKLKEKVHTAPAIETPIQVTKDLPN